MRASSLASARNDRAFFAFVDDARSCGIKQRMRAVPAERGTDVLRPPPQRSRLPVARHDRRSSWSGVIGCCRGSRVPDGETCDGRAMQHPSRVLHRGCRSLHATRSSRGSWSSTRCGGDQRPSKPGSSLAPAVPEYCGALGARLSKTALTLVVQILLFARKLGLASSAKVVIAAFILELPAMSAESLFQLLVMSRFDSRDRGTTAPVVFREATSRSVPTETRGSGRRPAASPSLTSHERLRRIAGGRSRMTIRHGRKTENGRPDEIP